MIVKALPQNMFLCIFSENNSCSECTVPEKLISILPLGSSIEIPRGEEGGEGGGVNQSKVGRGSGVGEGQGMGCKPMKTKQPSKGGMDIF